MSRKDENIMDRLGDLLPDRDKNQVRTYLNARRNARVEKPTDDPEYAYLKRANIGAIPPPKEWLCPRCQRWVSNTNYGQIYVNGRMEACPECSPAIKRRQAKVQVDKYIKRLSQDFVFANMQNLLPDPALSLALFPVYGDQKALEKVTSFVDGIVSDLLLSGPPARGKSGLAQSAVYALRDRGVQVIWLPMVEYIGLCKKDEYDKDVFDTHIREIAKKCEVLVIDDLGVEGCTEYTIRETIALLDYRFNSKLKTLITSNYNMDMLENFWKIDKYTNVGIPQPGDRLVSRVKGWYTKHEIPASYPEMR
jgi:DNA replication protein DnaC